MHETFVKDAENDVDRQEGGEDQDRFGAEGLLVSQQVPAKKPRRVEGTPYAASFVRCESGVAEGDAGSQIERDVTEGNRLVWLMESGMYWLDGGHGDEGCTGEVTLLLAFE